MRMPNGRGNFQGLWIAGYKVEVPNEHLERTAHGFTVQLMPLYEALREICEPSAENKSGTEAPP